MKRNLFVLALALLAAIPAAAQDRDPFVPLADAAKQPQVLKFSADTTVYGALQAITTFAGLGLNRTGVKLDEKLGHDVELKATNAGEAVKQLKQILDPAKYRFWVDADGILQVAGRDMDQATIEHAQQQQRTVPPPAAMPAPASTTGSSYYEMLANRYPRAYEPDGTIGSFAAATAMDREVYYNTESARYYGAAYGNLHYGGYARDGFLNYALLQQNIDDLNNWGALKFKKGRERYMANIEVWGCGQRLAQADEANNVWDHKVLVPVRCSPLTFRYTDGTGSDWEVEINEMIIPLRMQESKNITLDQAFFNRARVVKEYRQYSFIEQPNGDFKRMPREEVEKDRQQKAAEAAKAKAEPKKNNKQK